MSHKRALFALSALCLIAFYAIPACGANQPERMDNFQRSAAADVLKQVADVIRKNYYDPRYNGLDFEERVNVAKNRLKEVNTLTEAMSVIGWVTNGLADSHTFFLPPKKPYEVEHGWKMRFYGDHCFITAVRPGSDAEAKGLKPGDEVLEWEKYRFLRRDLWKMEALFLRFAPRSATTLRVAAPSAAPRELQVNATVRKLQKVLQFDSGNIWNAIRDDERDEDLRRPRWVTVGDTIIVRMPDFVPSEEALKRMLAEIRRHKSLVLDLRGNPGGSLERLKELVSGSFTHDVKIADLVSRKPEKPIVAKANSPFSGQMVVLIDSRSASAAELFARTVQLEKRGQVVGDQSSGSVMEARVFTLNSGVGTNWYYAVEVTAADLIMGDGKSLEKVGVTPDEVVLPTQADLAAGRDPMLARAIELAGSKMSPEKAGALFPVVWTPPRLLSW